MKKEMMFVFWIFASLFSFAQEDMFLENAISIGLENNYGIKIDAINIEIAENNNTWSKAGGGPIVDLNGFFTNNLVNDNNPASFLQGTYYSGSLGASLDAQWVVFNGGRVKVAKEQLSKLVDQQRLNQQIGIHDLIKNIVQQYNEVLYQQERKKLLIDNLKLSEVRLAFEKTKREFGASNSYNMIQFENAIVTDSTNLVSQEQSIDIAKRNLYNSLNINGFESYNFPENLSTIVESIDAVSLKKALSEENFTLKTLEMITSINALNTTIEKSARKPTISVSGSLGLSENAFKFFADDPNTGDPFKTLLSNRLNGNLNVNANWNLYDGSNKKANIQNAKLQQEIDRMSLLEAKAELNNQLDILISNYNNQLELIQLIDQQIQIARRNLEMTEGRFKAGQLSSIDYRAIQSQNLNIAFNKIAAIYNLIVLKSEIDYLVGKFEN